MWRKGLGRWRQMNAALLVVLPMLIGGALAGCTNAVHAKSPPGLAAETISVAQLPPQGRDVMKLIYQGGPFRYDKDGTVFGNRERFLPIRQRGYYREYTVRTPGERSRGARRIVCGGQKPTTPDACYYTDDHYASFRRIVQ